MSPGLFSCGVFRLFSARCCKGVSSCDDADTLQQVKPHNRAAMLMCISRVRLLCVASSQIALWTAGFVVMTLVINAPMLPWVMRKTGLAAIASVKRRMRAKAVRALVRFTAAAIEDLKDDQDEMLRGAAAFDCHSCACVTLMLL